MFSILNCNKKQYLQNCLLNYGINIPNVHVYHSKQSGVRTWLCFGLNPPQHTPLEQIKSIFKCPQTIYNVIRKQALDELPNTTEKPQCTTLCQGIVHHATKINDLLELDPMQCIKKWSFNNGWRSNSCKMILNTTGDFCTNCLNSDKNFKRDYLKIKLGCNLTNKLNSIVSKHAQRNVFLTKRN